MPAAFEPVRVSRDDTLVVRASTTLVTGRESVSDLRYRVTSDTPPDALSVAQHDAATGAVPGDLRQYTTLPADVPPEVGSIAQQVLAGIDNPADRATALRDYFRGGSFTYDPTVDLTDGVERDAASSSSTAAGSACSSRARSRSWPGRSASPRASRWASPPAPRTRRPAATS